MEILFLSRWFPHPADNGSKLRIAQLLAGLARSHRVTLISFTEDSRTPADLRSVPGLDRISEVHALPWREFHPGSVRAVLGLLHPTPRFLLDTFSADMASLIGDTAARRRFDLVVASQLSMASYHASFKGIPAIFEEIELGVFHDQAATSRGLKHLRHALTWYKIKGYFSRLIQSFQACTVASVRERELFVRSFPAHSRKVEVVPNCLSLEEYQGIKPVPTPNQLIFTGSFKYRANYDAMLWFVGEVFPLILGRIPDARLIITGDHQNLPLPGVTNIVLAGHVGDIKTLIASSSVSLAPLRVGGGTRLKILEAMALGTPVVSTSKGAEGLAVQNGEQMLIADTPEAFSAGVVGILENPVQRMQLSNNARRFVQEHFSWDANLPRFLHLVETAAQ